MSMIPATRSSIATRMPNAASAHVLIEGPKGSQILRYKIEALRRTIETAAAAFEYSVAGTHQQELEGALRELNDWIPFLTSRMEIAVNC